MAQTSSGTGHSADVRIELRMNGHRFPVAQIGRGMLIFDQPTTLPESTGELILTVDGRQRRWAVSLQNALEPKRTVPAELRESA